MSYQGIMKFKLIRKIVNHVDWWLANKGYYDNWADKKFLEYKFKRRIGRKLDLENPKAFNDKMQWLKLYDRNPKYTMMVDKYLVKDYVSHLIGNEYVIPTLGAWDYVEDIDCQINLYSSVIIIPVDSLFARIKQHWTLKRQNTHCKRVLMRIFT